MTGRGWTNGRWCRGALSISCSINSKIVKFIFFRILDFIEGVDGDESAYQIRLGVETVKVYRHVHGQEVETTK
jgi:hypothetical protein